MGCLDLLAEHLLELAVETCSRPRFPTRPMMFLHRLISSPFFACTLAAFALSSCSTPQPVAVAPTPAPDSFWKGDEVSGSPKLVINLDQQQITYFKGGQIVGASPISSGREGYGTRTGNFRVTEKDIDHRSSLYGSWIDSDGNMLDDDVAVRTDPRPPGARFLGASMAFFMRINGAVGMHEGYLPGYPASHGCIRLPRHMAEIFYHATPHGTPVHVVSSGPRTPIPGEENRVAAVAPKVQSKTVAAKPERVKTQKVRTKRGRAPKPAPVPRGTTLYLVE